MLEELDLVEEEDQFTHTIPLIDEEKRLDGEEILNVFKFDANYEENEKKYEGIKAKLLDEDDESSNDDEKSSGSDDESGGDSNDEDEDTSAPILDQTETNMIALRRTIYLTIQ